MISDLATLLTGRLTCRYRTQKEKCDLQIEKIILTTTMDLHFMTKVKWLWNLFTSTVQIPYKSDTLSSFVIDS